MRVLLLFSSGSIGGAEASLTRMVAASKPGIYEVGSLRSEGDWHKYARELGILPVQFGKPNTGFFSLFEPFFVFFRVVAYIRKDKPNYLYIIGMRSAFFLRLVSWLFPSVKLVHGIRWNPETNTLKDIVFRAIERFSGGLVDHFITNSKVAERLLIERCGLPQDKITTIYNGIETNIDSRKSRPHKKNLISIVANLAERKGHIPFLATVKMIIEKVPDVHFNFIGRDFSNGAVERAVFANKLEKYVTLTGFRADVADLMRSSKVVALPSLWNEGCPTAILEALSMGVPVVAHNVDGVGELVSDGQDGFLIEIGDYEKFADRILELLTDGEMNHNFGDNGIRKIKDQFSIEACTKNHVDVWSKNYEY